MKRWLATIMLILFIGGSLFGGISCGKKETETDAVEKAKEQYPGLFGEEGEKKAKEQYPGLFGEEESK